MAATTNQDNLEDGMSMGAHNTAFIIYQ